MGRALNDNASRAMKRQERALSRRRDPGTYGGTRLDHPLRRPENILGQGVLSPWDVGPSDSVYFSPLKQAVAPSEPNFWTHFLQNSL